ncbi:MAG: globin-coupled sensor protein [Xanthobacteraceae bacterium]|nr:globin-coupled sensor protein [Xanthobacteraceae bacterium]
MTTPLSIARRAKFAQIDERTGAVLREGKSRVMEAMPKVLDAFYVHVGQFDETRAFFRNHDHMMHAKAMQIKHWGVILDGRFDAAYEASAVKIGETHARLGLDTSWYIGGYNVLTAGLMRAIAGDGKRGWFGRGDGRATTTDLQVAVVKVALLDMDLVISLYLEATRRERRTTLVRLAGEFESAIGGVVDVVAGSATTLHTMARSMSDAAGHTASRSQSAASASEETSANVQAVAAASEQLSNSITEISRRVNDAANAGSHAESGVLETRTKMDRLGAGVQKIGSIVDLIANVAEQTNLLALNATIEAARAGDAGRGFAVVAQEVKSLAEQTAKATSEIAAQIAEIQAASAESSASITNIADVVRSLSEISTAIASAVEEQGAATAEIARNVQEASIGTTETARSLAEVSHAAGDAGEAAGQVLNSADELARQSDLLRAEVLKFLGTVKAA